MVFNIKKFSLAAVLVFSMLLGGCSAGNTADRPEKTICLWCTGSSVSFSALGETAAVCESEGLLSSDIRYFSDETELADAFNIISPDLIFCSYRIAEQLYASGHLSALPDNRVFEETDFQNELTEAHYFLPIGACVQLLTVDKAISPDGFSDMNSFTAAGENTRAFFSVSSYAELFAALLAQRSESYEAVRSRDIRSGSYCEIYNLFAEAALRGSLAEKDGLCRFVSSCELAAYNFTDTGIYPLPLLDGGENRYLCEYYGLVCTGDAAAAEEFISRLCERDIGSAALRCGLVPAALPQSIDTDSLSAALMNIRQNYELVPVDISCVWAGRSAEFDAELSDIFSNLK